ncbi:MAG: BatD family protein [Candidatus Omnitrophica bacterium]|nr:BatD family protein [Candidatus Omnitrophota bacterium]
MAAQALRWFAWLATFGVAALAFAQDLAFSAKVDKTRVDVGGSIQLTLTLSGDIAGVKLPAVEPPDGFSIAARSQATNFSLRAGAMERSLSLSYVLVAQRAGTFKLGPFTITHDGKTFETEPIEVTVDKPALPPRFQPQGERFTL